MKKYKYIIPALLLGSFFTACESELEIEPRQDISTEVALSTGENVENILVGTYAEAGEAASYGGRLQMMADLYGFNNEATWGGTFSQPREIFNGNIFVDNSFVSGYWLNSYEVINQANLVLDHVDLVDEDNRDNVAGQAYFLRALTYFDLVRLFGHTYQPGEINDQPGVPLTLTGIVDYSQDLTIARSSVEDIYNQVIADLDEAYELLPSTNEFYADKYAAQALLARVYLQQGEYAAARDAAHDVIENSGHSLVGSYEAAFNNDVDSSEDVFAFQVTTQGGTNQLVVHYADQDNGGRGGDITINDEYLDQFDSETDDRASFFYTSAQNGRRLTSKYTNQYGNIAVIRLAEMYLIRAEANYREGTEVGNPPVVDVNIVRERADADPFDEVTLADILEERERELAFEGFLIHDRKRTGQDVGDLPYDANALVFPIPRREVDVNPLLEQNPGYGS